MNCFLLSHFYLLFYHSYNSHLQNQSRLRALKKREDLIKTVIEESLNKLNEVAKDQELYTGVLRLLIAQSIFRLFENQVVIVCRKQDLGLVESMIDGVKKQFTNATQKDIAIRVDKQNFLPATWYISIFFE